VIAGVCIPSLWNYGDMRGRAVTFTTVPLPSAFKVLPILGECMASGLKRQLPARLADEWRLQTDYRNDKDVCLGDGAEAARRGGNSIPRRRRDCERVTWGPDTLHVRQGSRFEWSGDLWVVAPEGLGRSRDLVFCTV
jgi:hypothetical protein